LQHFAQVSNQKPLTFQHTFPWDYKTSESGKYTLNWSTLFIDFFAKIGWASDLKTVSDDLIRKRIIRTGPASQVDINSNCVKETFNFDTKNSVWGWDDPANPDEDKKLALILKKTISVE
jgi:stearoyl-CoA desaturase (Delta-9 desaturase)